MDITYKLQRENQQLVDFCERHESIYLYGAGAVGSIIIDFLHSHSIYPVSFLVTELKSDNARYKGIPVLSISDFKPESQTGIIITTSDKYHDQILNQLRKENTITKDNIYIIKEYFSGSSQFDYLGTLQNGPFFLDYKYLDGIGLSSGTDKSSKYHNYLHVYDFFLNKLKEQEFTLLELGVFHGESLKTWKNYFEKANIVGVDIDSNCIEYKEERIDIIIGDLSEISTYNTLREINAKIIIDDASHAWSHQIKAMMELFPSMPHGGIYIVEDIGTSFSNYKKSIYADLRVSTYEFLSALSELATGHEMVIHNKLESCRDDMESISTQIDMISFIYGSCIIIKK